MILEQYSLSKLFCYSLFYVSFCYTSSLLLNCIHSSWQAIYTLAASTLGVDPSRYWMITWPSWSYMLWQSINYAFLLNIFWSSWKTKICTTCLDSFANINLKLQFSVIASQLLITFHVLTYICKFFFPIFFYFIRRLLLIDNALSLFLQLCCRWGQCHRTCSCQSCWNEVYSNKKQVTFFFY